MKIKWNKRHLGLESLNSLAKNTLAQLLDIRFTEIGEESLKATMPVSSKTHQPLGLLHGGATAALAETVGSVASWLTIDPEKQIGVGIEINCNHLRAKKEGVITASASPLHIGATTHVWDIKVTDEKEKLIAVSRLTVAVLKKK